MNYEGGYPQFIWDMLLRALRMTDFLFQGQVRFHEYWAAITTTEKLAFSLRGGGTAFCDKYVEKEFFGY